MSSYYTTVSCEEWRRMQDLIKDADAYVIRNNEEIERLRKLEETRRAEFERIRQQNSRVIERAVDVVTLTGRTAAGSLASDMNRLLFDGREAISTDIEAVRQAVSQTCFRLTQVSDDVERIAQQFNDIIDEIIGSEASEEERVSSILAELDSLLEQIRGLHPEVFLPIEFAALEEIRSSVQVTDREVGENLHQLIGGAGEDRVFPVHQAVFQ